MRIVRPQPESLPRPRAPAVPFAAGAGGEPLRCRVRLADGRTVAGDLPPARHRAIQLALLHADSSGLVELTPGTRGPDGRLELDRRRRREHFLPAGASGDPRWLERLVAHAERIVTGAYSRARNGRSPREEAFVGVAARERPRGDKHAIAATRFLWLDIDRPERLDALWGFLAERPCHLLVASGGSGGVHAYWKLARALPATRLAADGTGVIEPIERAHDCLICALGVDADGRPDVADPQCRERARVMRLAGTINHKSGRHARVIQADFALAPYPSTVLVGDLPDPPHLPAATRRPGDATGAEPDPYKRIPPPEYFRRLAGLTIPRGGLVSCPVPAHKDAHPSCSVGTEPEQGWCCHAAGCGARGTIYDLASVLDGGPWGSALRGEAFTRARARVVKAFADVG